MQTRSRRKAVSAGSVAGPPRSLGSEKGGDGGKKSTVSAAGSGGAPSPGGESPLDWVAAVGSTVASETC